MKFWHFLVLMLIVLVALNNFLSDATVAEINGVSMHCENSYLEPEMWICAPQQ